jgi:tripartite-type tricarboxylate transporter receptor subunit TctC
MLKSVLTIFAVLVLVVCICATGACAPQVAVQAPAEFFAKNTVNLLCISAVGGGTDIDARFFAKYWPDATGGGKMINSNEDGIAGANSVYTAKPEGLLLGFVGPSSSMYVPTMYKDAALKVDIEKVSWFGSYGTVPQVLFLGKHMAAKSIEELKQAKGVKLGSYAPTAGFAQSAAVAADILGLDIKIICGYANTAEMSVAIGRKEIDGYVAGAQSYATEAKKGFFNEPLVVLDSQKTEWYPNVPTITSLAKLSSTQEKLVRMLADTVEQGKAFFGPPGMPADKLKYLRDTYAKLVNSEAFVKEIKATRYPVWEKPLTGEEVAKKAAFVKSITKDDLDNLAKLVNKYLPK